MYFITFKNACMDITLHSLINIAVAYKTTTTTIRNCH